MSQLTDNLNAIASIKSDIAAAIESKGVSMTGVPFGSYADKIGEIQTGGTFVTEPLNVTDNGVYTPGQGVDGYSQVTVNVPQSVTGYSLSEIASKRFMSESVINDPNVTYIDIGTFAGARIERLPGITKNLLIPGVSTTHYYFPNCTSIQDMGFYYNSRITYISAPKVSYIGASAFAIDDGLQNVEFPSCKIVADNAFYYCRYIKNVSLPACEFIGNYAFYNCQALETVYLPVCSSLSTAVFSGCRNLKDVYLLSSVKCSIGYYTFMNTNNNFSLFVNKTVYSEYIIDDRLSSWKSQIFPYLSEFEFNNGLVQGSATSMNSGYLNTLGISANDVTGVSMMLLNSLASSTFMNHQNLTYISLPYVQEYKDDTFNGCTSLSEVKLDVSVLGDRVFANCTSLGTVIIRNLYSVIQVGSDIFSNCPSLSMIGVPFSDYFTAEGWSQYSSLMSVVMPELAFNNGLVYGSASKIDSKFLQTLGITSNQVVSVSLPECKSVGQSTFYECHELKDVYLPKCEYLSRGAFYGANYINGVDLPVCSYIGAQAFYWCAYSMSYLKLGYDGVCQAEDGILDSAGPLNYIYVPASWVDSYKTANPWARWAYKILPITE